MIEARRGVLLGHGTTPTLAFNERVYLDCGCSVYIGLRVDLQEAAAVTRPCPEHTLVAFQQALVRSTEFPQARPLADVIEELLEAHPG